jgi:hypothetical protein
VPLLLRKLTAFFNERGNTLLQPPLDMGKLLVMALEGALPWHEYKTSPQLVFELSLSHLSKTFNSEIKNTLGIVA